MIRDSYKKHNKVLKYLAKVENQDFISSQLMYMNCHDVVDIGCFTGTLLGSLLNRGYQGKYTGFDVDDNVLNIAKDLYPNHDFIKSMAEEVDAALGDSVIIGGVLYYLQLEESIELIERLLLTKKKMILFHDVKRCRNKIYLRKRFDTDCIVTRGEYTIDGGHNSRRKYVALYR